MFYLKSTQCGNVLSEVDPETTVSRDVTDEEILDCARGLPDPADPDGIYMLNKFRTNQLISKLMCGAVQMGYSRSHFNPTNHMREARDEHTPHMPASCYNNLLGKIIGKTTGDVARHEPGSNLNAGDDGNFDIQMQERFVTKLARNRDANGPTHRQALDHIRAENYLAPAQVSIRHMPLTEEERRNVAKA